ncbi:MAG: hypothetical protein GQ546_06640, partial [Gammaproteobacteria bacterium]|nr:hypothetical protein [Gammaproteobacteria bacterium]
GVIFITKQTYAVKNNSGYEMNNVCDLPENISSFKEYLLTKNYDVVSIYKQDNEFEIVKDKLVIDPFYSKEKKIRFVGLTKKCTALDGVVYDWQITALISNDNEIIFQQLFLIYQFDDIYKGKRKFSFFRIHASNKEYSKLISKETVGILNKNQFHYYMENLGAIFLDKPISNELSEDYIYQIIPKNDIASRIAGWNFSKKISVQYAIDNRVKKVVVKQNH